MHRFFNTYLSIFIRLIVILLMIPLGTEIALRLWLYSNQQIPTQQNLPNRKLLIALGDSVTQQGYALEIGRTPQTPFPRENVRNYAKSGARIQYVVNVVEKNAKMWQSMNYSILIMVGHNDCRYLQHFATLVDDDPEYEPVERKPWEQLVMYRFYQEVSGMSSLEKRYEIVNSPRAKGGPQNTDRSMCLSNLQNGFLALLNLRDRYDLQISLMTYPIPKKALKYALNPKVKGKKADFVSVNWLVNREIRKASQTYQFPLLDAEECMKEAPQSVWHPDGLHLKMSGSVMHSKCLVSFFSDE